ncbi:hypothetical protein ABZ499_35525 [Streptomyces sp. NPDC019990]|uniref:hypothetical protein n=1 Tax=Streptomyces sp. NPDC019990 TaxID=3154693 RepID=UPI0033E50833
MRDVDVRFIGANGLLEQRPWLEMAAELVPADCPWYALARAAITYPETITLAQFIAHHPRALPALERPESAPPVHTAIAALLNRPWLQNRAFYPDRLNNRTIYAPSPRPGARPRWTYRQPGPTELTELGYHPPKRPRS